MNIKQLYTEYFEIFSKEIDKVLNEEVEQVRSEIYINPNQVDEYLRSKSVDQYDMDSNGWQWDFWTEYSIDDKRYELSGSGWYGGSITFSIKKETL